MVLLFNHLLIVGESPNQKPIFCAHEMPNNETIDGFTIHVRDHAMQNTIHVLRGHTDQIIFIAASGNKLCTASFDKTARIWDINTGKLLHTLQGHTAALTKVIVAGSKVITSSLDATIRIWDIDSGQMIRKIQTQTAAVFSIRLSGTKLYSISTDNRVLIWDINTGNCLGTLGDHLDEVTSIMVLHDKILTGSTDKTAKIWCAKTLKCLHTLKPHSKYVSEIFVLGSDVITLSADSKINVWDLESGHHKYLLEENLSEPKIKGASGKGSSIYVVYKGSYVDHFERVMGVFTKKESFRGCVYCSGDIIAIQRDNTPMQYIDQNAENKSKLVKLCGTIDTSTLSDLASYLYI